MTGALVVMTWSEFAWCLVLAAIVSGLVFLMVGYRIGVRQRPVRHVPSDCRQYGTTSRRPSAHEAFSPDLLQQTNATDGGQHCG